MIGSVWNLALEIWNITNGCRSRSSCSPPANSARSWETVIRSIPAILPIVKFQEIGRCPAFHARRLNAMSHRSKVAEVACMQCTTQHLLTAGVVLQNVSSGHINDFILLADILTIDDRRSHLLHRKSQLPKAVHVGLEQKCHTAAVRYCSHAFGSILGCSSAGPFTSSG